MKVYGMLRQWTVLQHVCVCQLALFVKKIALGLRGMQLIFIRTGFGFQMAHLPVPASGKRFKLSCFFLTGSRG